MLRGDEPVDPAARKGVTQRGRHGNGMDDIAQRAETDDQEARQFSRQSFSRQSTVVGFSVIVISLQSWSRVFSRSRYPCRSWLFSRLSPASMVSRMRA